MSLLDLVAYPSRLIGTLNSHEHEQNVNSLKNICFESDQSVEHLSPHLEDEYWKAQHKKKFRFPNLMFNSDIESLTCENKHLRRKCWYWSWKCDEKKAVLHNDGQSAILPIITMFKVEYRRHTNFDMSTMEKAYRDCRFRT
jgi:hypothetical protein